MADHMRFRYGDTNFVVAAVDADVAIEMGDLLWQDGDDAKPASVLMNEGIDMANRYAFAAKFLGVAMQRSRAGESSCIRVATTGVFEFDCPAATFELGDLVAVDVQGPDCLKFRTDGDQCLDQQVTKTDEPAHAIGRVAKRELSAVTSVLVDIRSAVMGRGVG